MFEFSSVEYTTVINSSRLKRMPLKQNLHEAFIGPFEQHLRDLGGIIHRGKTVAKLITGEDRITGIRFEDGSQIDASSPGDIFVLATPPNTTGQLIDDELFTAEQTSKSEETWSFADLAQLKTAPMAGATLYLSRRVEALPKEPVTLTGSPHYVAFVDISQQWDSLKAQDNTVLSLIAANFAPLQGLSHEKMKETLIAELGEYIPIDAKDVAFCHLQENLNAPLFLNTAGAWPYRPRTKTRLANMYITGDYCQTPVDLTTMESAVTSGLMTAKSIVNDLQGAAAAETITIHKHETRSRAYYVLMKYALLPVAGLCHLWHRWRGSPTPTREQQT